MVIPPSKPCACKALAHDHGRDLGVDLQQTGDLVFEGIELAGRVSGRVGLGSSRYLHASVGDTQGPRDFAHGEALMGQAVDLEDGAFVNHDLLPESGG